MKKLGLLLILPLLIIACGDDEKPTFKKENFIGKWEVTDSTIPPDEDDDCVTLKQELEITNTQLIQTTTCDGDVSAVSTEYTFDGKQTLSYELFGESKLVISSLSATTMKVGAYYLGTKYGVLTLKKVS